MSPRARHTRDPREEETKAQPAAPAPAVPSVASDGPERQQSALATVDHAVGAQMVLQMQRGQGNAYVSRIASGGAAVARRKSAAESVGGSTEQNIDMVDDKGRRLELGKAGFTDEALEILPRTAGMAFASEMTQKQMLTPVTPRFADVKRTLRQMGAWKDRAEQNAEHSYGFGGMKKRAEEDAEKWAKAQQRLNDAAADEERLCKEFNAGVPRANRVFVSLARLDALMATMGITDPAALTGAVTKSLQDAQPVAEALKSSRIPAEKKTVPEANDSATEASSEVSRAQEDMAATWTDVQSHLEIERAGEVRGEGDADREKKKAIDRDIELLKNAGKTIDVSLSFMGVGLKGKTEGGGLLGAIEGKGAKTLSDAGEWTGGGIPKGGAEAYESVSKAIGLEIPTDVSGILETAGKLYYYKELEQIRFHLSVLESVAKAHEGTALRLGALAAVKKFKAAVNRFEDAQRKLQTALQARLTAYAVFGQQLDVTAAKEREDPAARAQAPGRGKERFASVMAITALAREVLVVGAGAEEGMGRDAGDPGGKTASQKYQDEIDRLWEVNGWSSHYRNESRALGEARDQLRRLEGSLDVYRRHLEPIDKAAAQLLGPLVGGQEHAKY